MQRQTILASSIYIYMYIYMTFHNTLLAVQHFEIVTVRPAFPLNLMSFVAAAAFVAVNDRYYLP